MVRNTIANIRIKIKRVLGVQSLLAPFGPFYYGNSKS